jgi:hypothetical protein
MERVRGKANQRQNPEEQGSKEEQIPILQSVLTAFPKIPSGRSKRMKSITRKASRL